MKTFEQSKYSTDSSIRNLRICFSFSILFQILIEPKGFDLWTIIAKSNARDRKCSQQQQRSDSATRATSSTAISSRRTSSSTRTATWKSPISDSPPSRSKSNPMGSCTLCVARLLTWRQRFWRREATTARRSMFGHAASFCTFCASEDENK